MGDTVPDAKIKIRLDPQAAIAQLDQMEREAQDRVEKIRQAGRRTSVLSSQELSRADSIHASQTGDIVDRIGNPVSAVRTALDRVDNVWRDPIGSAISKAESLPTAGPWIRLISEIKDLIVDSVSKGADATDFLSNLWGNAGPTGDAGFNPLRDLEMRLKRGENTIAAAKDMIEQSRGLATASLRLGQADIAVSSAYDMGPSFYRVAKETADTELAIRRGIDGQVAGALGRAMGGNAGAR